MKKVTTLTLSITMLMALVISFPLILQAAERSSADKNIAIQGKCPICILEAKDSDGQDIFIAQYHGKTYKFDTREHRDLFVADPVKYLMHLDNRIYEEMRKNEKKEKTSSNDHSDHSMHNHH